MPEPQPLAILEETLYGARHMDVSLNERLSLVADEVRARSPDFAAAVDRLVARLKAADAGAGAPSVGEPMPPFALPDETGTIVELGDLLRNGPVAVQFRRGFWCPYCRLSTAALADAHPRARALGADFVVITPDRGKYSGRLRAEFDARFPFLTDIDNAYALSLNLAIWVGEEMERELARRGRDLVAYHGSNAWTLPIPATFVVGTDGAIKARHIDPDYRRRLEIDELLSALAEAG